MPDMETDVVTDKRTVPMAAVRDTLTGDIIGELVHTALRKYTDRGSAAHRAIAEMPAGEWPRAMTGVANDLIGYVERAATEAPALTEQDRIEIAAHQPVLDVGWCRTCRENSPCLVERLAALLGVVEPAP